uniref:Uncharacterized protein YAE1-like isoform X3 n=1 Tax=Rhizophora mucronata TaxID=61149 RepID=A0A2P2JIC2_RHIMU
MENSSFAEELYSGSLRTSHGGGLEDPNPTTNVDLQDEDGSLWYCSDEESEKASDRDREWQKRCKQHHTVVS